MLAFIIITMFTVVVLIITYSLLSMAAPSSLNEQLKDDEDQINYLKKQKKD